MSPPSEALRRLVRERAGGPDPVCLYGYDLDALAAHVAGVVAALPAPFRMYYAMKANAAAPVLRTVAPLVAGFEIASGGELAKVRAVAPAAPVLFGGPGKTPAALAAGLAAGVRRFHVESELELHRLSAAATAAGRTAEVLLRVNLAGPFPASTLAMAGRPTQFGIDEAALGPAVATARRLPGLRPVGFHLHSVSNVLDADAHLAMLAHYRRVITGWERRFGLACEVVDVGGGVGVDYADLDRGFDWDRFTRGLAALELPAHWREVDLECGRYLVAGCGVYAAEVLDVKRNHGETYVVLRGGTHQFRLPASWQHSHPFEVVPVADWPTGWPRPAAVDEPVTVVGELCTPKDVLARGVRVPRVRAGDVLLFHAAGAYGWDISHREFLSHPHPEFAFLGTGAGG